MKSLPIEEIAEIKEFRGIKSISKPIPLKKINILIGKNNSGKSTLLEVLYLFPDPDRIDNLMKYVSGGRNIKNYLAYRKSGSKSLIYRYDGETKLVLKAQIEEKLETWEIHLSSEKTTATVILDGKELKKRVPFSESLYLPNDTNFIRALDKLLEEKESRILKYDIHKKVAKFISENLDEKFTEITLKKDGWSVRREDGSYINLKDLGDGVKKVVRAIMIIELSKPKLILWDDFDTSLHPTLIKNLLKYLAQGDWQVVIATHNIDVLYSLLEIYADMENFDAQILMLRKVDDILYHIELNMDELQDLIDANTDPRLLVSTLKI